jgi:hypothetical protein
MKKLVFFEILAALLMPLLAMAQSDFDGTWKIDLNKIVLPTKPDIFLLQNGVYQCKTCIPVISVKADGQDHSVAGSPYYDTVSIRILNDQSIEKTEKKSAKTVATSTMTVSPDGNTATFEFTDRTDTNSDPITGKETMGRVAKSKRPFAGSLAISGSWQILKMESVSDNALMFTFKLEGDSLTMSNPTGQSYTAKMDGTDAPYKGDTGIDSISLARLGKSTIVETYKHNAKPLRSRRIMVAPSDANTMSIIVDDRARGTTVLVARKQ